MSENNNYKINEHYKNFDVWLLVSTKNKKNKENIKKVCR